VRLLPAVAALAACTVLGADAADADRASGWVDAAALTGVAASANDWLTTGHDYADTRFSALTAIDAGNVSRLRLAWSYDLDTHRGQEATPVEVDGVLYTTSAWSKVYAFDARSGRLLWHFDPQVPGRVAVHACCDVVNRGVALWQGRVYVATLDGRLIALDARTGHPVWSVMTVDPKRPYTVTGAPLAVNGRIIIGNAGAEFGVRGYVSAYDAASGHLLWRFYTIPGDPARGFESALLERAASTWSGQWWKDGGGATVWNSFSYDPQLDLLYFGTGNVQPWGRKPSGEPADSLLSASIIAVHASSGEYAWHYQATPGDIWDYDSTQNLALASLEIGGRPRQVIMQASKNGFFYVLDRTNGQLISAQPFVPVTWAQGVDPKSGRPRVNPEARYDRTGKVWVGQPGAGGAHNWQPMSYSPLTALVYIPAQEMPFPFLADAGFKRTTLAPNMGIDQAATSLPQDPQVKAQALAGLKGYLLAWDPLAQRVRWRAEHPGPWNGGVLTTAGNLVFQGTAAGELVAYRASDGARLWSFATQTGVIAAPMTYAIAGRQYVTVMAGWGGVFPLVSGELAFKSGRLPNRSRVLSFALDGTAKLPDAPATSASAGHPAGAAGSEPTAPTVRVDPVAAAQGARVYARHCGYCHGDAAVSGGLTPDLRYTPALANPALFRAIVNDGALESQGMVAFRGELDAQSQDAVRAYLIQRTQQSASARPAPQAAR